MKKKLPWDIIISKLRGNLSEKDSTIFSNWLEMDDNNQLFHQLEILWKNIQTKTGSYEPDVEYYWKELSARMGNEKPDTTGNEFPQITIPQFPLRRFFRYVAVATLLLAITFSGAYFLGKNNSREQSVTQTYSSITGKSMVILPDGSEVWLHANTTLSYNSNFKTDTREVTMNGEAFFNVTHNAKKPFIVTTGGVTVMVHGTRFNVSSFSSSSNIIVSLLQGSVSMKTEGKNVILKPGEEGRFDKLKNTLEVHVGDVDYAKSWTNDQLHFEKKSLRYVCRYLSKWYSTDIQVDPAISDNQSYTFTVRNENLEEIIRIMARINSINYYFDEDNRLILKSKKQFIKN